MAIPLNHLRSVLLFVAFFAFVALCNCSRESADDGKSSSKQSGSSTSTSTNTSTNSSTQNSTMNYNNGGTGTGTSVFTTPPNNNNNTTFVLLNAFMSLLFGTSLPTGGVANQQAILYQSLNCQNNGMGQPLSLILAPNDQATKAACANNANMQIGSISVNGTCKNVANGGMMSLGSFCAQNGIN